MVAVAVVFREGGGGEQRRGKGMLDMEGGGGGATYFLECFDDVVAGFVVHEDGEGEGAEFADAGEGRSRGRRRVGADWRCGLDDEGRMGRGLDVQLATHAARGGWGLVETLAVVFLWRVWSVVVC